MYSRPVVVMKFGGTSVGDSTGRAALTRRVREALETGRAPVVVVSAMGRKGVPYATDTLLALVAELPSDERERDLLAATGEIVSAVVVAHELRAAGITACALSGPEAGIFTDGVYGSATVTRVDTAVLQGLIAQGHVPVVAGFQGISEQGTLTTLGRGGSDTTACVLGVALGAEAVEIYTDVDGVMTADPRVCTEAAVLDIIGADELFQMARNGSRVVHTPAAELALGSGITVRVKNTFSDHPGTHVTDLTAYAPSRVATAVSQVTGIARFRVTLEGQEGTPEHTAAQREIYAAMAAAGVSLDMFTPCGSALLLTVENAQIAAAESALASLGASWELQSDLAKVTLVGSGMHGVPGVMARAARCLAEAHVSVLQTADSHTTISVLVPAADVHIAVDALHEEFALDASAVMSENGGTALQREHRAQ